MSDKEDLQEFNERIANADDDRKKGTSIKELPHEDRCDEVPEVAPNNEKKLFGDSKMWAVYGHAYSPCEKSVDALPAGQYTVEQSMNSGIYFNQVDVNLDELMTLPDSEAEQVIDDIETFWSKEDHFRKFGFLWKRGILLWGPPGSGKTSVVQIVSKLLKDNDGLSIYIEDPALGAKGLELLRRIEPNRPIVVIIEDVDSITQYYGESAILALLDGELQIDNVVFIATTNYPERLDKRLTNRPSRFDIVKKIGMPSDEARKLYIYEKNERLRNNKVELEMWVKQTKNFSLAHIKELIVSVEVFEVPFEEAIERLTAMMDKQITSEDSDEKSKIGFVR